jgi:formate-dependent nitrite reductase complex subunit NrfG
MTMGGWRTLLVITLLVLCGLALAPRWQKVMAQQEKRPLSVSQPVPQSGDDWALLGDRLMLDDRYPQALFAYRQALTLRGGDARLYAALAVALYYQNGQQLTPEVRQWIDSALAAEPDEVTALMLLASDAFLHADYSRAITLWTRVLDTPSPRVNRQRLVEAIGMAQRLADEAK